MFTLEQFLAKKLQLEEENASLEKKVFWNKAKIQVIEEMIAEEQPKVEEPICEEETCEVVEQPIVDESY